MEHEGKDRDVALPPVSCPEELTEPACALRPALQTRRACLVTPMTTWFRVFRAQFLLIPALRLISPTLPAPGLPLIWTLPSFLPSGLSLDILWVLIKHCAFWKASPVVPGGVTWSSCILKLCVSLVLSTPPHNLKFRSSLPREPSGSMRSRVLSVLLPS